MSVALTGTGAFEDILHRDAVAAPEFGLVFSRVFAGIGLVLSAIGVFSVMSYSVSLQTHDIGIRMALGAQPQRCAENGYAERACVRFWRASQLGWRPALQLRA